MNTCAICARSHRGKVYSDGRCQRCYRRALRISRGLPVLTDIITRIQSRVTVNVGSSRVDLQACKLEYSIVSPK